MDSKKKLKEGILDDVGLGTLPPGGIMAPRSGEKRQRNMKLPEKGQGARSIIPYRGKRLN